MFATFRRGWALTKTSLSVVRQDKELLVLPVLSGVGLIMASALVFGLGYYLQTSVGLTDQAGLGLALGFYFVSYFITIYFNTALVSAAKIRLDGGDPTLGDAFKGANGRIGQILGWTLVAATVGLLLQLLERVARERGGMLAGLATSLVGMAWNLATYFVVPVIVAEGLGPIQSVKRSASVFKRTWGEMITSGLGIGAVFFGLGLLGLVVFLAVVYLVPVPAVIAVMLGLVLIYWAVLAVTYGAASQVLVAALYRYATQGETGGVLAGDAAKHLFDGGDAWARYQDPKTGRIMGA